MTSTLLTRGILLSACLGLSVACQAQTAEFQEQGNSIKYSATPETKLVLANATLKEGVGLERLPLLSGEGNMDKKVTAGLLAGAFTLMGARAGGGIGTSVDFAEREPIKEHLSEEDASKIGNEALAILLDKLRAAGVSVDGPEAVASAPFYADVKGETAVGTDSAHQDGGLFKKTYYYGFYNLPVAGLKFRKPGMFEAMGNDDLYPKARAAANAGGALDVSLAFYNDKKVFGLFDMGVKVWGKVQGRDSDVPMLGQVLKNKDDFTVPSGGKDAYAYWTAFKPKFEGIAVALADRMAKALTP